MDEQKRTESARPNDRPVEVLRTIQPAVNTEIGEHDVLLGRGKKYYNHEGNVRFRKLVMDRALAYKRKDKAYRKALACDIINIVQRNEGKFLRSIEAPFGRHFRDVPTSVVLTKVKQALRDMSSRISAGQKPTTLAACDPAPSLLVSMLQNTVEPSHPSSFSNAILSSSHPHLSAVSPFHPLLTSQPIGQDSEASLFRQLACLQQNIQQRQQIEKTLQVMGQQTSLQALDQHVSDCFQGSLALPQQTPLCRLTTPMPNQQLSSRITAHRQGLIRRLKNDLHELASLDPGLQVQGQTQPPPHQQHEMQETRRRLGLDPLPHELSASLPALQHDSSLETPIPPESHGQLSKAAQSPQGTENNGGISSRGLSPIPITPVPFQKELDHAQLPQLDDVDLALANEPHDTFCDLFDDDHMSMSDEDLFVSTAYPATF